MAATWLYAQAPTNLVASVLPPSNSVFATATTNPVFVTITNFDAFTNVTVVGTFNPGPASVNFLDNGQPPDAVAGDGTFSADWTAPATTTPLRVTLTLTLTGEVPPTDPTVTTNIVIVTTNLVTYFVVPRPANDNFTNALKIPAAGGTVTGTNNFASIEPGEPFHGQDINAAASVWWNWSPAINTNVLIDTAGSSFNPVLAVYTGDALDTLVPIAASTNDPLHSLKAHVNFDAIRGKTYRLAVAGYDTNGVGAIVLRVVPGGQPDYLPPVVSITNPPPDIVSTTNLVTVSGLAKDPTPNATGVSQVWLQVNGAPPTIAAGTTNWSARLDLLPGTNTVLAYARDVAGNVSPPDQLVIAYINPTNDDFADSIELTGTVGVVTAINGRATLQAGEPLHCNNEGGHSIWYFWRAPAAGVLMLTTTNSTFDTLLDLYTGDMLTNLLDIACVDGFGVLAQQVVSNTVYHVSVDGYGGQSGNIQLQYRFVGVVNTQQFVNLTVDPPLGGSVSPGSETLPIYNSVTLTAAPEPNYEFIAWAGDVTASNNPLTLTLSQDTHLTAQFHVATYVDSFESGDFSVLPWVNDSSAPWTVQPAIVAAGRFAARSGPIGDSQSTSLRLAIVTLAGTGSFDLRVSSEAGYDWLEFWVNGALLQRWSGEVDWQNYQFRLAAGMNQLEWRYTKDANYSVGLDAAFLDNLYLPLTPVGTNAPLRLTLESLPDGSALISLPAQVNRAYRLQTSTDLRTWAGLATNVAGPNGLNFVDPQATNLPTRFYRVLAP